MTLRLPKHRNSVHCTMHVFHWALYGENLTYVERNRIGKFVDRSDDIFDSPRELILDYSVLGTKLNITSYMNAYCTDVDENMMSGYLAWLLTRKKKNGTKRRIRK